VLADAATAAVFAPAPLPLVLAEDRGLAGLLGCRRMWRWSCGWTCGRARCIGWVHITLFVLAALALWPSGCVPLLQHSLLAPCGSLRAIRAIQHPALRRILHVEASCAVGAALPLSRGVQVSSSVLPDPTVTLFGGRQYHRARSVAERQGGPRGCLKKRGLVRTTPASRLCSLRGTVQEQLSLSRLFLLSAPKFCQSHGTLPRVCQKSFAPKRTAMGLLSLTLSLTLTLCLSLSPSLSRSLDLSPSLALALSLFVSSQPRRRRWKLSTRAADRANRQWRLQRPAGSAHADPR
jgi:hypothetical protein